MGILKQQKVQLLEKHLFLILSIVLLTSCHLEQGIQFEYPVYPKLKQNLEHNLIIKVKNNTYKSLTIEDVNASCNCLIIEDQFPMFINPKGVDTIEIKIYANEIGENIESIVVYHNFKDRFENIRLRYEVY